jgi:hypothetical protein
MVLSAEHRAVVLVTLASLAKNPSLALVEVAAGRTVPLELVAQAVTLVTEVAVEVVVLV